MQVSKTKPSILSSFANTFLLTISIVFGVASACIGQDSTRTLTFDTFMRIVREHHPIALQSEVLVQKADAYLTQTRGSFDPVAYNEISQKYYNSDNYYSLIDAGLKVPTWFGIELKGAYEQNQGVYLNPENNVPNNGLVVAGISVPLGQGLIIDKRRADLRKAKISIESSLAKQQTVLNELMLEAGKVYWKWFESYHSKRVMEESVDLAQERFDATKSSALIGERPAIDTLEAGIQLQNRKLGLQQAQLEYQNTSILLSVYLWSEGVIPMELSRLTTPVSLSEVPAMPADIDYVLRLENIENQHPGIAQLKFAISQLEVDRLMKRELIKPKIDLKYNAINEPINNSIIQNYSINNYTWGLEFKMPLFVRQERGALRIANLQIQEANYALTNSQAKLLYEAKALLNAWNTSAEQITLYSQTVRDYLGLLDGERTMFNSGESSLFMVNSREIGYINAQLKLIELTSKNRINQLSTAYTFGILNQQY